jgi:hypothetical protein
VGGKMPGSASSAFAYLQRLEDFAREADAGGRGNETVLVGLGGQILRCTGLRDRPDSAPEPRRLDIFRPAPGPRRRRVGARNSWIVVGGRSVPSSLKSMIHPFGEEFPCSDFWRSNRNSEQV